MRPLDGLLYICVIENQERGLAAGFEGNVLEIHARHLHDQPASTGGACESDLVYVKVASYGRTCVLAVAVQNVDNARREACFLDEVCEIEDTKRCLFGWFHDNGVTASQRGPELP